MDGRTGDRKIVLKVRLNQAEYDALAAMSAATGYPMGAILRNGIRHNKQFSPLGQEQERCQAPSNSRRSINPSNHASLPTSFS